MGSINHQKIEQPSQWRAVVYLDNGKAISAPGIYGHGEAFDVGFALAEWLKTQGERPEWVATQPL